jgi:hypothetical protein
LLLFEVPLELVTIRLACGGGCWRSSPDAAISRATVRPNHGVQGPGDQLRLFQLIPDLGLKLSGDPYINPSVIIAGVFDPECCIVVSGLAILAGCHVTGDIDRKQQCWARISRQCWARVSRPRPARDRRSPGVRGRHRGWRPPVGPLGGVRRPAPNDVPHLGGVRRPAPNDVPFSLQSNLFGGQA